MKTSILTLFPEMFKGPFDHSIIKRALDKKIVEIEIVNIRDFGIGKHKVVDDKPYGGGSGMLLRIDVVEKAISYIKKKNSKHKKTKIILLDPKGKIFNQKRARQLAKFEHLILICGHYEGIDERINNYINEKISIGDYVLTGGELAAMIITDSVMRLIPKVLGKDDSCDKESFEETKEGLLLEYPQYTRPSDYKEKTVPKILLSGNHRKISQWRKKEAIKITRKQRPDLIKDLLLQNADAVEDKFAEGREDQE